MGTAREAAEKIRKKKQEEAYASTGSIAREAAERIKRYQSIDITGVDQNYIDSFITDANTFLTTAEKDYGGVGWGNASSAYDSKNSTWQDLYTRADTISAWLFKNKNSIDGETYNNLNGWLSSFRNDGAGVIDTFKGAADYYSQWQSEDEYNKWYEGEQKKEKEKQEVLGAGDFNEYLKQGKETGIATDFKAISFENNALNLFSNLHNDYIIAYREDPSLVIKNSNPAGGITYAREAAKYAQYMTDDEYNIYTYYYGKYGKEKAEEYLNTIAETINARQAGTIVENVGDSNLLKVVFAVGAGLDQFASGIGNLDNFFKGTEADPTTAAQYASGIIREDMDGLWGVAYDLANTTGNMLPSILVGSVTGGIGGALTMGVSASGNAYAEMRNLGYDEWQSRGYGALVGASETVLQYALGGISKLGGKVSGNVVGKLVLKLDNALARTAIQLGGSMASEGLEEAIQTVLEPAFKALLTGESFEAPEWEDVLYSGLLGALSAGLLEGVPTIATNAMNNHQAKNLYVNGADLVTEALDIDANNAFAQKMQAKVDKGKSLSGGQINRLVELNEQTLRSQDTAKMKSAVEARLTELGETGDVSAIADVIVKARSGEKLTSAERAILVESQYGRRVSTEMNPDMMATGEYSSAWAENIGTERVHPDAYNKELLDLANETAGVSVAEEKPAVATVSSTIPANTHAEKETVTESQYKVSEDGKTMLGDTEVSIKEIASVKDGKVTLRLEDGSTVDARDVEFGSNEEGLLYENVSEMGLNAVTANAFVSGYDGNISVKEYVGGFRQAYRYGEMGIPKSEMNAEDFAPRLTASQKELAYNHGAINAKYKADEKQSVKAKVTSASAKDADNNASKGKKKGKLHNTLKPTNETQRASLKALGVLAEALGIDIYTFESPKNEQGQRVGKNGWYNPVTREMGIDLFAGSRGRGTMLFTAAHELTHHIREKNPTKFKAFADFLFEHYGKNGKSVAELIADKKAFLESKGRITSDMTEQEAYDLAYEEVVADSCESFLADGSAIQKIAELKAKDKTLWQTIKDFFTKLVARIQAAYKGLSPDSYEGRLVAEMLDTAEQLKQMWTEMLVEASEIVAIDADTKSVSPMFSERTWTASEYVTEREKTAKAIVKALNVDIKTAYKYIDDINGVAKLIADDRARLDYEPNLDDKATVLKPNSEYKYTVDMSTLCAKRLLFTGTFDAIQRALPNTVFDSEDIVALREMMQQRKYEVACGICYVEYTRREIGRITQDFIDSYKEAQKTGKPITRLNSEGKTVELKKTKEQKETTADKSTDKFYAEKGYTPTLADLNTTDIDLVKRDHPLVYEAYLNFMNARGQAKPKLLETRAEYKGEILKHFKYKSAVNSRNNAGGLRLQSFSDFEVPHLIDMMQIVMDMSRVGLKSQAYTKVPAFAEVFGDTGVKINLSLIAKGDGLDANGNLIFDDVEGINHKEAFALRDKYSKNVGTILVGKTDAHIIAAMADPRIDYIIPFHKSSWKESLYDALGLTGYADYTDTQNEKPLDKDRKIKNFDPSEYWDFTKSGDENAQIYLEKCREDGRIPKFPQFQGYPGYWKLLIDFKMYDNDGIGSPQEVVQPIFDTEASERILREYKGGHKSFPVAKDVVEEFVKEHKDKVKYSDRDSQGNELSEEQQEFFKDSKVRDHKGNLLVVYHGTTVNFNTFKKGDVGFHFGTKGAARGRVGYGKNVILKEVYLNITNSIVFDEDLGSWDADYMLTRELFDKGILTKEEAESVLLTDNRQYRRTTEAANKKLVTMLLEKGYDGIEYTNTFETKNATKSYIVFNSNQVKLTSNKTPTESTDIRYSFRNSESGTANDALSPYNEELTRFIEQRGDYIVDSFTKLKEIVNLAFDNTSKKATAYFGIINEKTLEKIKNSIPNLPKAIEGILFKEGRDYSIATTFDAIRHIVDDKSLNREDVIDYLDRFADTILEFDSVVFNYYAKWKDKIPGLLFKKRYSDGTLVSFDLVSSKKRSIVLQTLYMDSADYQKKKSAETLLMQNAVSNTPKTQVGQTSVNSIPQNSDSVKREFLDKLFSDRIIPTGIELQEGTKVDKNGKPRSAQAQRDAGYMLSESKFYQLYTVHKLDIGKRWGDLDKQVEDIKKNGFKGGSGTINIVPSSLMTGFTLRGVTHYEMLLEMEGEGKLPQGYAENFKKELGDKFGKPQFNNIVQAEFAPRAGDRLLFVPGSKVKNNKVVQGFIPLDYEVVTVEYDFQPYYELYKSAYDKAYEQTHDGKVLYSDRTTDSVSNRSLLANALESVAQNDVERNKLAEYKSKIALIESEQAKLAEIRAKLKELSFAKGKRDTEALKKLQFEANQTANRINTYDRQLLNLESTKALKGVLDREKQMAYKRAEQKGREALKVQMEKDRERNAKTQRKLLERYQESVQRGREGRKKTEMRYKLKKVVNELNQYLLNGTKEKHVPIELQLPVAEALRAVNMDTVGAEERIAKKREEMRVAAAKGNVDKVNQLAKEIDHIQEMGGNLDAKLSRLQTAYDSIINSDDPIVANAHDEVISNTIAKVIEVVGDTPIRDMSLGQLEAVYDMYKMVLANIRKANKAFKVAKGEEISTIANGVIAELKDKKRKSPYTTKAGQVMSAFDWNNLKPVYAFERIGSLNLNKVFNCVLNAEGVWATDMSEAEAFRIEQQEKYDFKSFDFDKKYEFTSTSGDKFELNLGEIMSLYAWAKDEDAKTHLFGDGFQFDPHKNVVKKTKAGIKVNYNFEDATSYKLSQEILDEIIGVLDGIKGAKEYADAMQDYLASTMGEKGNAVSLALYEIKLFKNKVYWPLKVSHQYLAVAKEQAESKVRVKNKGFTNERKKNAKNTVILSSFMDVWADHVHEMSMYHAFTLPLEDFRRVIGYNAPSVSEDTSAVSVRGELINAHGKAAAQYIDQLFDDINGGAKSDPRETLAKTFVSRFKKASVVASLSVTAQQPTAIVRAMALVSPKYFVGKKVNKGKIKGKWETMKKYAPVCIIKDMGGFDTGMGVGSVEWLKGEKTFMDKVDDALGKAPEFADKVTWVAIWNAVERETVHKNKNLAPNSEEFLKAVGERFTEVIQKTQVYDSTLARSANMRSKGLFMTMLTSFMAEPTTSINMLADGFRKIKSNPKYFARAMGAVYGSVILNAAVVSLIYAMRDDDEDETYLEKYVSRFVTEIVDGVNPLTYIPGVKDVWSIAQGFDVERADMSIITDVFDSLQGVIRVASKDTTDMDEDELAEHYKAVAEAWMSVGDGISSLFGLPVKNIRRDINGVINLFKTLGKDQETTAGSLADKIGDDLKDSIPVWGWLPKESKGDKLYDAIMDGDEGYIERMKEHYEMEHFYAALREEGPIMAHAVKEVIISAKMDEGKTLEEAEESFVNGVTSVVKRHFDEGDISYNEAMDILIDFCGLSKDEAKIKVQYWEYKQENPDAEVEASWFKKYNEDVASSGISIDMYIDYRTKIKGIEGDKDKNGNTISGSKKAKIMAVINSLPISNAQKDALYFAEGWTESKLWEAPWH